MIATRPAAAVDIEPLAALWHQGWHEAHGAHVPDELTALRTLADFERRLREMLADVIAAGPEGAPVGFVAVRGAEIYQIYVGAEARGTGAAAALLAAGEARIRVAGHGEARLDCLPENARGRAFYRREGWDEGTVEEVMLDTSAGPFPLRCVVFRKALG